MRLSVKRLIILEAACLVPVCLLLLEKQYGKIGTIMLEKQGGGEHRKCSKLADDMESPLGLFKDKTDVLIETEPAQIQRQSRADHDFSFLGKNNY